VARDIVIRDRKSRAYTMPGINWKWHWIQVEDVVVVPDGPGCWACWSSGAAGGD
jgi:hypothetical protein